MDQRQAMASVLTTGRLPAGMRNNNPGNIKFIPQLFQRYDGVVGPSVNTDQGDPQAVFKSPEYGMRAMLDLAQRKYDNGKITANQLIAGQGGWTPGHTAAAANIARMMGLQPDDDLNLRDQERRFKFARALMMQEHGEASKQYSDDLIRTAMGAPAGGQFTRSGPFAVPAAAAKPSPPAEQGYKIPDFMQRIPPLDARNYLAMKAPGKDRSHVDGLTDLKATRLAAFLQDNPHGVEIISGARSVERQTQLWNEALKKYGSEAEARKWVAPPGKSQHNHGNAADLRYKTGEARKWAHENAAKYGLTFPLGNEPWHVEVVEARQQKGAQPVTTPRAPAVSRDPGMYAEAPPQAMGMPAPTPAPQMAGPAAPVGSSPLIGPDGQQVYKVGMLRDPAGGGMIDNYATQAQPTGIMQGLARDAQLTDLYNKLFGG
jgi:LAS superfamily LD-carboxypeptidase LdcB